jgi:hypothetical protein
MSTHRKTDPKFVLAYDRGMYRSSLVSLFWAIISDRKKRESFTLQGLAKTLGKNKGEVSRWFTRGDPNWTANTVASIANALNVDLHIVATERATGAVYTPAGLQTSKPMQSPPKQVNGMTETTSKRSDTKVISKPRDTRLVSDTDTQTIARAS